MNTFTKKKSGVIKQTPRQKLQYVKKNWHLYIVFLMPAFLLTIIFKYIPMSGVLIAFEDYNVIDGVFGSEWVGLEYFQRFLSSPDFMDYFSVVIKPYSESRNSEENSIIDLCTKLYFRYRTLWYGSYVPVSCGSY